MQLCSKQRFFIAGYQKSVRYVVVVGGYTKVKLGRKE